MASPDIADEVVRSLFSAAGEALLVVTGAGVSVASGIPAFRGPEPDAVWNQDVTELGTERYFREDPVGSWRFYLGRFDRSSPARPNAAHTALVDLERWQRGRGKEFLLVTQNVDGLHRVAGSSALVEVHGRADRVRCAAPACVNAAPAGSVDRAAVDLGRFRAEPSAASLPRCPQCGELVRPHLLWFDERYDDHRDYEIDRVAAFTQRASAVLFAGTSFAVGLTDMVLERGLRRRAALFTVDPSGVSPHPRVVGVPEKAEEFLPRLVARLQA